MEKQQLEKFTDWATGVAIISLIVFFSLPIGRLAKTHDWHLAAAHLILCFFSLYMIIVFWAAQANILALVILPRLNAKIVWLTRVYFIFLTLLPFAAGWIADNPYLPGSILIYISILLTIAVLHFLLLHAALYHQYGIHLLSPKPVLMGPACYLLGSCFIYINICVTFILVSAAGCFYYLFNKKIDALLAKSISNSC